MYKVFRNEKPIILTDSHIKNDNYNVVNFDMTNLQNILSLLDKESVKGIIIRSLDLKKDWVQFKNWFRVIKAAGGKVLNDKKEVLFIYRFGKWDLPKGHIEKGEDRVTAALREVEEECGINELKVKKELETTYHIFSKKEEICLKMTYWFLMYTSCRKKPFAQKEEGIISAVFKNKYETKKALENTYENIGLLF